MAKAVTGHIGLNMRELKMARNALLAGLKAVELGREHLDRVDLSRVPMKNRPDIHKARLDLIETKDDLNSAVARIEAQIELGLRAR